MHIFFYIIINYLIWLTVIIHLRKIRIEKKIIAARKPDSVLQCIYRGVNNNEGDISCFHPKGRKFFCNNLRICPVNCKYLSGRVDGLTYLEQTRISLGARYFDLLNVILGVVAGCFSLVKLTMVLS